MTTEDRGSDASGAAERRGLSRRQMIQASAVAGAAAWTAPVIIDSLTSPAAARSGCTTYYFKSRASFSQCWTTSQPPHCNAATKGTTNNTHRSR